MKVITLVEGMKRASAKLREGGERLGFVPTMGFLHEGHLSLVRRSLAETDATVVSIFVNPAQFGPGEDFQDYPRDLDRDVRLLEKLGVDVAFVPREEEMYPKGYRTYVEVHDLQDRLLGKSRPGHFRGVCTVVLKLFEIVRPDAAYFGEKDAQQALIIRRMVRDLHLDVDIRVLPIVREKDGLALSSRNVYLDPAQRKASLCLVRSLREAEEMIGAGERRAKIVVERMREIIRSEPLAREDYVSIVDLENLEPLARIEKEALVALGVYIGKIRLIDSLIVRLEE